MIQKQGHWLIEHKKMGAEACWGIHWIINNMDIFVDCKLYATLPAATLHTQLPAPTAVSVLPPLSALHNGDVNGTVQPTLAPDV